jgi:hypothetical protein
MNELETQFQERYNHIVSYLEFIEGIEALIRSGVPRLGESGLVITTDQQRILNSCVYLQLYNLIEATITSCLDSVSKSAMTRGTWTAKDLVIGMQREWVKYIAKINVEMNPENRLEYVIKLCEHLINSSQIMEFEIEKGGGGNWDDEAIYKITKRIGIDLNLSRKATTKVKRKVRDDLGSMQLVVRLRNKLAHGNISFVECGQYDGVDELRDIAMNIEAYLREVVNCFDSYIKNHEYIQPSCRPQIGNVNNNTMANPHNLSGLSVSPAPNP